MSMATETEFKHIRNIQLPDGTWVEIECDPGEPVLDNPEIPHPA